MSEARSAERTRAYRAGRAGHSRRARRELLEHRQRGRHALRGSHRRRCRLDRGGCGAGERRGANRGVAPPAGKSKSGARPDAPLRTARQTSDSPLRTVGRMGQDRVSCGARGHRSRRGPRARSRRRRRLDFGAPSKRASRSPHGRHQPMRRWMCTGCYLDARPDGDEPPQETMIRALDALARAGVFTVAFGGGEPTTRDDLHLLATEARARGLTPVLTTSGLGLTSEKIDRLRPFAQVNVSYDGAGADYERVRGFDGARHAEGAIEALVRAGIPVGVNVVLTQATFDSLDGTLDRARALGAREAQLLRYKPAGRAASLDYLAQRLTLEQARTLGPRLQHLASRMTPRLSHSDRLRARPLPSRQTPRSTWLCSPGSASSGAKRAKSWSRCASMGRSRRAASPPHVAGCRRSRGALARHRACKVARLERIPRGAVRVVRAPKCLPRRLQGGRAFRLGGARSRSGVPARVRAHRHEVVEAKA